MDVECIEERSLEDPRIRRENGRPATGHEAADRQRIDLREGFARPEHEQDANLRWVGRERVALDGRRRRAHRVEELAERRRAAGSGVKTDADRETPPELSAVSALATSAAMKRRSAR